MGGYDQLGHAISQLMQERDRRFYGKYRGIVTDNQDPNASGRIKARVPELFDDQETGWAMPCVPYAAESAGFLMVPEVDQPVWIEFEAGDPSRPIWAGCWWPAGKAPSVTVPDVKVIYSSGGNKITLDDTSGSEKISIEDTSGATLTISQQSIEIKKGGMKIELTDSQVSVNGGALTVM